LQHLGNTIQRVSVGMSGEFQTCNIFGSFHISLCSVWAYVCSWDRSSTVLSRHVFH